MVTTSRERQRKWKVNQTSAGKRAVIVMLAPDIKDLIDKERKKTGETITSVIEKAIVNFFKPAPADSTNDKPSVTSNNIQDLIMAHPDRKNILRAVGMFNNSGTKASTIASLLSDQNYKTFYGNNEWTEEDVKEIVDFIQNKNRRLYWEIVY
jgi:hypothetical protein